VRLGLCLDAGWRPQSASLAAPAAGGRRRSPRGAAKSGRESPSGGSIWGLVPRLLAPLLRPRSA